MNIIYKHHSGPWGLAKFFLADMLTEETSGILVIDTDYVFGE
jgi:hypothetical protein